MVKVSMLEFRRNAKGILRQAMRGSRMVLTYRGKPVLRFEPLLPSVQTSDDGFYRLAALADSAGSDLSNAEMDGILYGG